MGNEITDQNPKYIWKALLIVLLLFSFHFWGIRFIPQKFNLENLFVWVVCGACFLKEIQRKDLRFKNAIILLLIGLVANVFSAYLNNKQSPYDTILAFSFIYFILLYFFLHSIRLSRKYMEDLIIVFAIIFAVIYIVQVSVYPYRILTVGMDQGRGTIRMRISGNGFLVLAYFLLLNRYLVHRQLKNLLLALAFFVVLLMGGFRTLTAGALLLSIVMFIKIVPFTLKDYSIFFVIFILFLVLFQFERTSNIFREMISSTEEVVELGDNYIRFIQFDFFFTEYPKNISYYIFGGGMPGGLGTYYFEMRALQNEYGLYWVDIGLFGFYIVIGGVALAGLLWYTLKAIFIKLPKDKVYLNFYFLYLLVVSLTTAEIYRGGIFVVEAITLYLIDVVIMEESKSDNEPDNHKSLSIN